MSRAADAAPMLLRMPNGAAETGHSIARDVLPGGDASPSSRPSSIASPPAAREVHPGSDSIVASRLQRATGGREASVFPSAGAGDTSPGDEPAPRDGKRPAAALAQVSEMSRAAVTALLPLQRMPAVSAAVDHSALRDRRSARDASSSNSPPSIPAAGHIRLGTDSIAATQLQLASAEGQSLAGSGAQTAVRPLIRVDGPDDPRPAASKAASAIPVGSELPRSAAAAQPLVQRWPDGAAAMSRSTRPDFWPDGKAMPLSGPSSAPMHRQHNSDDPPASGAEGAMPVAGTAAAPPHIDAPTGYRGAVSAEIRAAPLPGVSGIVWRKADANGAGLASAAPAPAIAQMVAGGGPILRAPAAEPASGPDVTPAPAPESSGPDVFLIAEQVSRIVTRQLRIERERRGLRR
ncbi:MAG TPA: hypothetical protein VFQ87_05195 [Bradyrhizobium sp.]|nr:hypothetical protein [Bradyrhizobium sp.]